MVVAGGGCHSMDDFNFLFFLCLLRLLRVCLCLCLLCSSTCTLGHLEFSIFRLRRHRKLKGARVLPVAEEFRFRKFEDHHPTRFETQVFADVWVVFTLALQHRSFSGRQRIEWPNDCLGTPGPSCTRDISRQKPRMKRFPPTSRT